MKLGTFHLSDTYQRFEIRTDSQKIFARVDFTAPKLSDLAADPLGMQQLAFFAGLAMTGKISVTRYKSGTTKKLIDSMSIYDAAEIAANNEGYIYVYNTNPTDATSQTYRAVFSIELSNSGNIRCTDKDFLLVEFEQMAKYQLAGTATDATWNIYTYQASHSVDEHLAYVPVACQANQTISFNVEAAYGICVPVTCKKLVLNNAGANSSPQEFTDEELENLAVDGNDIVWNLNGKCLPFQRWRFIPIQFAKDGTVLLSESASCYLLVNKNYEAIPNHS